MANPDQEPLARSSVGSRVAAAVESLLPGYFALVMATGIVSVGAWLSGFQRLALALLYLNVAFYAVLWGLTLTRVSRFRNRLWQDVGDPRRAPGFLTMVAGTAILGGQFIRIEDAGVAAAALFFVAAALWLVILYGFLVELVFAREEGIADGSVGGSWLLLTVSTQSLSVLAVLGAASLPFPRDITYFSAFALLLLGGFFYLVVIQLVIRRLLFFRLTPPELTPDYWISMGACAITTLAGSVLLLNSHLDPFLGAVLPFIEGFTLLFWVVGTWWIPFLTVGGIWRHVVRRYPLTYEPRYWSLVFPLGMYAASTMELAEATELPLESLGRSFFYVGLGAWSLTFAGLVLAVLVGLAGRTTGGDPSRR